MRINKIKDHQKRLCCLKVITVGVGLCLSMQSNANDVEKVLSKNAFNQDAEPYRVCRRQNFLRNYTDEKTKLYP